MCLCIYLGPRITCDSVHIDHIRTVTLILVNLNSITRI